MSRTLASIVVPAHNEERALGACLHALLEGTSPGELDVVVVANACTDATASVARELGVRVIETPVPGKAHAVRLGDQVCRAFPRVYLDADVVLSAASVRALVAALAEPGILACAPRPDWDLSGVSWVARRVHTVHDALVEPNRGLAGVGAYVLGAAGHTRVFPLPDVVADDEWVHRGFAAGEVAVVDGARSVVRPARTVRAHLRRRVRVRRGNQQLVSMGRPPAVGALRLSGLGGLVAARAVGPVEAVCYLAVKVVERAMARRQAYLGVEVDWASDTGSRAADHPSRPTERSIRVTE